MPTEVLHGKISQRSIKFCFNCGAKINGSLWTLIEEGIIKEKWTMNDDLLILKSLIAEANDVVSQREIYQSYFRPHNCV